MIGVRYGWVKAILVRLWIVDERDGYYLTWLIEYLIHKILGLPPTSQHHGVTMYEYKPF